MSNYGKSLIGEKFGKLTVIKFAGSVTKGINSLRKDYLWECICECGNVKTIPRNYLVTGNTNSCGCLHKINCQKFLRKPAGQYGLSQLYGNYRRGAKVRNLEFSLTKEQFKELTSKNCHYCNIPPLHVILPGNKDLTEESRQLGKYTYNGIDRVNNNLGYFLDNCVTCCKICNFAKQKLTNEEFLFWIKTVYSNLLNKGLLE